MKSCVERSLSLLHVFCDSISRSFPELLTFGEQFRFADKASTGSAKNPSPVAVSRSTLFFFSVMLDALLADMKEVELNFLQAKKERELKGSDSPPSLVAFLDKCEKRIENLKTQCKTATVRKFFCCCFHFFHLWRLLSSFCNWFFCF